MPFTTTSTCSKTRLSSTSDVELPFSACTHRIPYPPDTSDPSALVHSIRIQERLEYADKVDYRFAVKAGAKHVIGVDMSTIIVKAREIVEANGMSDKITLLQGKMEEVELPFPEVDIIISEWMGYFLLYESMMDTVLWARDRYLRKDGKGLIFPDKATIFMAGIEDGDYKDEKIGCKFFCYYTGS